eukprot:COSAG06_NODE_775_length_12397_cov_15.034071_8_plen_87_part_00
MPALDPGRSFCIGVPGVRARSSSISDAALNWPCRTAWGSFGGEIFPALGAVAAVLDIACSVSNSLRHYLECPVEKWKPVQSQKLSS